MIVAAWIRDQGETIAWVDDSNTRKMHMAAVDKFCQSTTVTTTTAPASSWKLVHLHPDWTVEPGPWPSPKSPQTPTRTGVLVTDDMVENALLGAVTTDG